MKGFRLRFTVFALAVGSIFGIAAADDGVTVRDGHVYRIVNVGYNHAMKANGAASIATADIDENDGNQLWIAEAKGDGFYMRALSTGYYISSSRARSKAWETQYAIDPDDSKMLLKFIPDNGSYFIHTVSDYGKTDDEGTHGYAHENAYKTVVGWNTNSTNTRWSFVEASDITTQQIADSKASWLQCVSDITPGRAYRIRNYHYGHNMVPGNNNSLVSAPADNSDENQIWIVEQNPQGEGYYLRHYATGKVVASSCTREKAWSVVNEYIPSQAESAMYFNKKQAGYGISTISTRGLTAEISDYTYAHENNLSTILGYVINSNPSLWHFTMVDEITPADIAAKTLTWDCYKKNTVDNALAAIFTDYACTELTPEYATKRPEDLDNDPNVLALPEGLRPMVRKVLTGDWSETDPYNGNEWDSTHARKFRVQMYEPFSECGHAATLAGIQAYTDLNNPTGIVTDNGNVLYVMVDKEPADGSTLYIAGRTGEGTPLVTLNSTTDGFRLRKGLNVVPCDKDLADMIIYYTVRTTNNRTRLRHVTDYEDIKIHIEGGSLNGYFNNEGDALYTPDTNEDWLYYRERARHAMFTLLSRYATLYIHFHDIFDENGNRTQCLKSLCSPEAYRQGLYDLRATMKEWDKMYVAETLIMGLLPKEVIEEEKAAGRDYYDPLEGDAVARDDYYKYFNNRVMGISLRECGFMNATWYRTAYNPSTISSIIREFPTGDIWGPAHEFGHLNQGPMCIAGTTEESNNVFSNVVLFYRGTHSSRADFPSVQRRRFNEGQNFHQHDTWGTTRMWFQLWLYYHYLGHDKRFYPRLYELLRTNPLHRTHAPGHDGVVNPMLAKDDLLHFAKMACVAAGEDLTDFFESWGFLVEQDGYYIGDYTSYTSYLSAEDIAQWKADIAQMAAENNWKKNTAIIFIDDRVGSTLQSYGFDNTKCGSMGGLKDFTMGAPVTGNYTYTVTGTTVSVTGGQGGVGFLIYDKEGKLIGFANEPTFEVSAATAGKMRAGEATFKVVAPDNVEVTVTDAVHDGTLDQRLEAMDVLLAKSAEVLATSDREGRKAGFLKPEVVGALQAVYDDVKGKRDADEITVDNNVVLYDALYAEFMAVRNTVATVDNTISLVPDGIYVFTSNALYPGKGITANNAGTQLSNVNAGSVDMDDTAQQWVFEPADEDNYYYIRNVRTNKYIGKAPADKGIVTLQDEPMRQYVVFRELGGFSVSPLGSDHDSLHDDGYGRLTRWDSSAKASRWTLTLVNDWERKSILSDLNAIIAKSETLLSQAGTVRDTPDGPVGEPGEEYQFVTGEMLVNLHKLVAEGKSLGAADPAADLEQLNIIVREIIVAHDVLLAAMNRNADRLVELIGQTRTLAATVAQVTEQIVPVTLTEEDMYSNAPHMSNGGDKFTTWDVLFDNNHNTYFHSTYDNVESADGLDHYIRIALPEIQTSEADYIFSYVTRKNGDSNWFPAEADLEVSTDGENWVNLVQLSADELPFGSAYRYDSAPLTIPAGMRYLRFIVHKNRRSAAHDETKKAGKHYFFVLSELSLSRYDVACEPDTETYPIADAQTICDAMKSAYEAQQILDRPDYGHAQYDAAYDALLPHYQRLMEILDSKTGLDSIRIDEADLLRDAVIYTLTGQRVRHITAPGIYIVNGKKYLLR